MKSYVYFNSSGVIEKVLSVFKENERLADVNVDAGQSYIFYGGDNVNPNLKKINVSTRTLVDKTEQSITATPSTIDADGVTKSTLSGIESGSKAYIDIDGDGVKEIFDIPSGKFYFCTDTVATHEITITHPLYLDTRVSIIATAP